MGAHAFQASHELAALRRRRSATGVGTAGAAMFSAEAWSAIAQSLELSGRELQIVRRVFDDQVEFAIAADLHIAPRTVHSHVERLYHKLAITNRTQLAVRVMREFLALTASPAQRLPPVCGRYAAGRCRLLRH